ncbi:MAG TPA: ABC transporter permease subunit, partial [Symbiobacteriaceae bacterium]|nr:ABC transporter permease subunit [Symbiobacteriaceae bacterium]
MKSRRFYLYLGLFLLLIIVGIAIGADHVTKVNPYYVESRISALEPKAPFPPSAMHPLGTDSLGRDLWSRIAFGARWSLLFAAVVAFGRILIALPLAWLAVVGPKPFRWLVEKLYVLTNTVPPLLLYLILLAVPAVRTIGLLPSIVLTLTLLTLWEWPRLAGTIKGRMEQLMQEGYVEGAIATGAGNGRLFRIHLLPHLMPLLLRVSVGEMGQVLLTIAHLGLFGVWVGGGSIELVENSRGAEVQVLTTSIPEWGTLLSEARDWLRSAPWIPLAPAGAFFLAITSFHLVAQGLEAIPVRVRHLKWWGMGVASVAVLVFGFSWLQTREVFAAAPAMAAAAPQMRTNAPGVSVALKSGPEQAKIPPASAYMEMKGFQTDLRALYVPWDPSREAFFRRFEVNRIAYAADRAASRVKLIVGAEALGRPTFWLYPTPESFAAVTDGAQGNWAVVDGQIAIAPGFTKGLVAPELVRALVYTQIQAFSQRAGVVDPIVMGRLEKEMADLNPYRPDWQALVGSRLPSLTELYAPSQGLKAGEKAYMTATALLVEFLAAEGRQTLTTAAVPTLAAKYDAFLYARIADQSMLTVPAVRREIPAALITAFEAAAKGQERLLMHAVPEGTGRKVTVLTKDVEGVKLSAERWEEVSG